jgi:SAM-dependent methyltransferase
MGYVFDFKDAIAYEQWLYHPRNKLFADLGKQLMCDMLLPKQGETLLDIGCGTGSNLLSFLEMGVEVTGLDPSPYMLDIASKNVRNRADLHRGFAEDLPFEDNTFNYSCLMATLEFVEDPKKAIEEVSRVTKDRIFIGVLNRYAIKGIQIRVKGIFIKTIYNHAQFFSILELKKIIRTILGDVPVSWRTVSQFPLATNKFTFWIEKSHLVQKCPFGSFVGIVVTLIPRFKTRSLELKYRAKQTAGAVTS